VASALPLAVGGHTVGSRSTLPDDCRPEIAQITTVLEWERRGILRYPLRRSTWGGWFFSRSDGGAQSLSSDRITQNDRSASSVVDACDTSGSVSPESRFRVGRYTLP